MRTELRTRADGPWDATREWAVIREAWEEIKAEHERLLRKWDELAKAAGLGLVTCLVALLVFSFLLAGCGAVSERLPADDGGQSPQADGGPLQGDGGDTLGLGDLGLALEPEEGRDGGPDAAPDGGGDADSDSDTDTGTCEEGGPNECDACGPMHPDGAVSGAECEPSGYCPDGSAARFGVWRCSEELPGWYDCAALCPGE